MAYYQHNMLSINSRTLLANILAEIVLLSESIQTYREALANIHYFDCIALFRFLDREEKGYLREKDFQRIIGTSHRKLLSYAFSWFDNMKVGEISRLQFSVFLLPKDNLQLRQLVAQRVQNPQISYSQHETILQQYQIFRNLILEIMNKEMIIIELRRKLVENSDYTSKAAISAIDCNTHEWVCADDIYKFMKNYGFNVNLRQVEKLVEVLNYDMDGKITQDQLKWTLQGFQAHSKEYLRKIKACNKKQHKIPSKTKEKGTKRNQIKQNEPDNQFQYLIQKFEMAVQEQRQIDNKLKEQQQKIISQNQIKYELKLLQHKKRQQIHQIQQYEYQEKLIQTQRNRQMIEKMRFNEEMKNQMNYFNSLSEKAYQDSKERSHRDNQGKRLYSFAEESFEAERRRFQIIDAHVPRRDYTNLLNLSNLSMVQSYRRASSRPENSPYYLIDSSNYINTANSIKQRIKVERQIEKSIQDKFTNGQYDTSRFNSRVSDFHLISNPKLEETHEQKRSLINNQSEGSNKHYHTFKSILEVQNKKRDSPKKYSYGIKDMVIQKGGKEESSLIKQGEQNYESPQKVPNFYKSGGANKFTAATNVYQSSQK